MRAVQPERAFLAVGGVLGVVLLLVSPPLYWGDENTHFLHAYRLALLRLDLVQLDDRPSIAPPGEQVSPAPPRGRRMAVALPRGVGRQQLLFGLDRALRERGTRKLAWSQLRERMAVEEMDEERVVEVKNANYPLLGYAPQAVGVALARLATRSVLLQLYGARLANLAAWLGIVYAAIRLAPTLKVALAVLALSPMSVFVATTCSADAGANALAFLWTAAILRRATLATAPRAGVAWLVVLAVAMALVKVLYAPLVLLVLAVPADRFGGPRRRALVVAGLVGVVAIALGAWGLASRAQLASGIADRGHDVFAANLATALHEPGRVAAMVARVILMRTDPPWIDHVSEVMLGVVEPAAVRWSWLGAVGAALLACARGDLWPRLRHRAIALGAALGSLSAVALGAFLFWTPAGADWIAGFQGRYAIPVLPALAVALYPPARLRLGQDVRARLATAALAAAALLLLWTIVRACSLYG